MYGAILGDIIGSIYEWKPTKQKDFPLFKEGCTFTDDTVLTIAVADGFNFFLKRECPEVYENRDSHDRIRAEDIPEDKLPLLTEFVVHNMLFWGRRNPYAGYGASFGKWLRSGHRPYNSWGNGSAMRVSAVGWMFDDIETTRKMAALQSAVSHDHPEGIKGAEAVASAVFMARSGCSKEEIREYIAAEFGYDMDRKVDEIRPEYKFYVSCQESVPEAIIAFLDSTGFEDAVRNAVSLGGDSDTQGAMAGAIAEAYYGVPEELKKEAEKRIPDMMRETLTSFSEKWMQAGGE